MKKSLLVFALVLGACLSSCSHDYNHAISSPNTGSVVSVTVANDGPAAAAHHIEFDNKFGWARCSSTSVGTRTILTAAHCVLGTGKLTVDGKEYVIASTLYDENDHVIVVLDGAAFLAHLDIDQRKPVSHEHIRIWGWPGGAVHAIERDGVLSRTADDDKSLSYWELPVYHGDSGSGVVTDDNKLIAVVSTGDDSAGCGTYRLLFTPEQLQAIR